MSTITETNEHGTQSTPRFINSPAYRCLRVGDIAGFHHYSSEDEMVDLSDADLSNASLHRANLSDAVLIGANLSGTDLRGTELGGADLSGANLSGADLSYTDLSNATLSDTDLSNATYNAATKWPQDFDPAAAGAVLADQ